MNNVLAIETSGATCTVGLSLDGNRFVRSEHVDRRHNERLLPMLSDLIAAAGETRTSVSSRVEAVGFGRGPGSFTGVRIAAAAAQAIALAWGAGVLRLSSSEILAQRALNEHPSVPGVLTSIRSRRDLHYLAAFRNDAGAAVVELPDALHDRAPDDAFSVRFSSWMPVGEPPTWWRGADPLRLEVDGDSLITVALRALAGGRASDPADGLPEYLEGDGPWRSVST